MLFFSKMSAQTSYTETPEITPKQHWILESAFLHEQYNDETDTHWSSMIRKGISKKIEVRLFYDLLGSMYNEEFRMGLLSTLLGLKYNYKTSNNSQYAVLVQYQLGDNTSNSIDFNPSGYDLQWVVYHQFSNSGLGYNLGLSTIVNEAQFAYTYALIYNHLLHKDWSIYLEYFGNFTRDQSVVHRWGTGFSYQLSNTIQFESTITNQMNAASNLICGVGINIII